MVLKKYKLYKLDGILLFLIESMKKTNNFVSGEIISEKFNISRTAVWKRIQKLKKNGHKIIAKKNIGYKLLSVSKKYLCPEFIKNEIKNTNFDVLFYPVIDSTNTVMKNILSNQDLIIITDYQEKGRGRLDRKWNNTKNKDIAMTIGINVCEPLSEFYKWTIIASLSVFYTLSRYKIEDLKIKWPNDIYIGNKKICGILSEMITEENLIKKMIIGIGINVNSTNNNEKAISLYDVFRKKFDRNIIISDVILNFNNLVNKDFDYLFDEWKEKMKWLFNNNISIQCNDKIISGVFKDVDKSGGIIIEIDGKNKLFYAGDILT